MTIALTGRKNKGHLQLQTVLSSDYVDTLFLATIGAEEVSPVPNPIPFNETRLNPGGHYDNTTGIYTIPIDGIYEFNINVRGDEDNDFGFYFERDGVDVAHARNADGTGPGYLSCLLVVPVHATAGQQFWVRPWSLDAIFGRTDNDGELTSWFAGRLISAD